jgi:glycosyltransferase involved in cell wall biosynthesis
VTGWLVPSDDAAALATAIADLATNPSRRLALGAAGLRRVRSDFDHATGLGEIYRLLGLTPPDGGAEPREAAARDAAAQDAAE